MNNQTGWQVGDKLFDNKWDAIQYATDNPQSFKAYCNDPTWDKADWTREPTESIEQLQKNHAEYLREKYKTLVLFFSGGVDSATVLDTFIKNKIPLDYIHLMYVNKWEKPYNIETHLAMQYLKDNEDKLMGAEIQLEKKLDQRDNEGNSIYTFDGNLRDMNIQLRFHHCGHARSLEVRQPETYQKVVEDGCIISGGNKAYVYKDENGFYTQYTDKDDENWGEPHLEMFYLGEDPTLQIKQCHLAKQWMEEHNIVDSNKIYKSDDKDKFWSLNQSFGRVTIDEYFNQKHCFGGILDDEHFRQGYGIGKNNHHWARYFDKWQYTESYYNLIAELDKVDDKFHNKGDLYGWWAEKRYLD